MKKQEYIVSLDVELLHEISTDCDPVKIEKLVNEGASLNPTSMGQKIENIISHMLMVNPLIEANLDNIINTIKFFINEGVSLNPDGYNQPLNLAIDKENIEVIKLLLDNGAYIHGKKENLSPMDQALYKKNLEIVKLLIEYKAEVNPSGESAFLTPLIIAAQLGSKELVEFLLSKGAQLNPTLDTLVLTPLIVACESGNFENVKLFIEYGAEINPKGENLTSTPLISALRNGKKEIIEFLLENKAEIKPTGDKLTSMPIIEAASLGDLELIKRFIEEGADVNSIKYNPMLICPLGQAVFSGNKELVKFLLEKGANPNLFGEDFLSSPLSKACQKGDIELVKLLIEHKAEINPKNIDILSSPLSYSVNCGNLELVKYLISQGAEYKTNSTILITSAMGSRKEDIFDHLTQELKLPLYPLPEFSQEYIFTAIQSGQERIKWVKKLIDLKANLNVKNIEGKTVMNVAYGFDDKELVDLLEKNGVQKNPNEQYMPSWIYEYYQIAKYIPYLYPQGKGVSNNTTLNNPNRFKKIFETQEKKEGFLKQLESKFDQFIKEHSVQNLQNEFKELSDQLILQIKDLELQKFDIRQAILMLDKQRKLQSEEKLYELNERLGLHFEKLKNVKSNIENCEKSILMTRWQKEDTEQLKNSVNNTIERAKKIKEKALNSDSLLYDVIEPRSLIELIKQPEIKTNTQKPVKVFVIDGFEKNDELECSTFNHPQLDDKFSKEALNKKLEADSHATHVCGIISQVSNKNVVFDIENLRDYNENTNLNDAKIVNLSIGSEFVSFTKMFDFFLRNEGKCIFVKALGNESTILSDSIWLNSLIKHEVLNKHVIFVGNIMSDGETISPSSNIPGDNKIIQSMTVSAPGTNIDSCIPIVDEEKFKKLCSDIEFTKEGHTTMTGTSMATPFVSGLAAILLSKYPTLPLEEVVKIIKGGCTPCGESNIFGNGLINFEKSIELATEFIIDQNSLLGEDWFLDVD